MYKIAFSRLFSSDTGSLWYYHRYKDSIINFYGYIYKSLLCIPYKNKVKIPAILETEKSYKNVLNNIWNQRSKTWKISKL